MPRLLILGIPGVLYLCDGCQVASLQGDLQGIAGSEMPQLPGFGPEPAGQEKAANLHIAGQLNAEESL
jgi:hypothetical protein